MLHLHRFFAAIALGAAALLFALLALRDKVHFLSVSFGDALSDHALVKTAQQLLDCLSISAFDFHRSA
jgi:hypothetical protein